MGSGENVWPLAKSVTGEVGTSTGSRGDTGGCVCVCGCEPFRRSVTEEKAFPAPNTLRRCCYGKSEVEGRAVLCQGKLRGQAQVGNPRDFLTQQPTVGGLILRETTW